MRQATEGVFGHAGAMESTGTIGAWQQLLVGLVLLLGVVGTLVPGVPGPLAVWAAVFWWSMTVQDGPAWYLLVAATALLLAHQALQLALTGRLHRDGQAEVPRRSLLLAGGAGIVGFFVLPVVGAVLGFVAGLYAWERGRLGGHAAAAASTRTALRSFGWRTLLELLACLLVAGGWLGVLLWA